MINNDSLHSKGCYSLILKINKNFKKRVGKLGVLQFEKGFYLYSGSARLGILKRVKRYTVPLKNLHWHIDYVLESDFTKIENIVIFPLFFSECKLFWQLNRLFGFKPVFKGFGASDCKNRCFSHFSYKELFDFKEFDHLFVKIANINGVPVYVPDNKSHDSNDELFLSKV